MGNTYNKVSKVIVGKKILDHVKIVNIACFTFVQGAGADFVMMGGMFAGHDQSGKRCKITNNNNTLFILISVQENRRYQRLSLSRVSPFKSKQFKSTQQLSLLYVYHHTKVTIHESYPTCPFALVGFCRV